MATRSITPPEAEPVTLEAVKADLRVDFAEHDLLIATLISGAREQCEHILGRSIMEQTWQKVMSAFTCEVKLFFPEIIEVTSIKYIDASTANETTLPPDQYYVDIDSEPGLIRPAPGCAWPSTLNLSNAVRIEYTAGYESIEKVPASLKNWIMLAVRHMYQNCGTEGGDKVPEGFYAGLLDRYRIWSL